MAIISKGYVLAPRIFYESELGEKPPHFREIFHFLVSQAAHAKLKTKYGILMRGQLFTSYVRILNGLKWYVGRRPESYKMHQIETAMKYYIKTGMITRTKTKRGMIITVCNYDYYQNPSNYENQTESQRENDMKPRRKPVHKQEEKKIKKVINVCETNTHTFLIKDVENLFNDREKKLGQKANPEAAIKFFDHYNLLDWTINGKPMEDLTKAIDKWIREDERKRKKAEDKKRPKSMMIQLPEQYHNK